MASDASSPGSFRKTLTIVLVFVALLTAGSVVLFGHLLFKTLSKGVVDDALLRSRLDAERIAKGMAERAAGDLYTLKYKQTEIDNFVGTSLSERQILTEVQVLDKSKKVLYTYRGVVRRPEPFVTNSPESGQAIPAPGGSLAPVERSSEGSGPVDDPYNLEVPIGDFGVLRVGVSRRELAGRVEKLRTTLYFQTALAAGVSLLGIAVASAAILLLIRRARRSEAARVEAERRAELGEVAAGLAHEIRNPLNAMSLNLELLEEQIQKMSSRVDGPAAELAQSARQETGRLARMLTDFLAYARPSPIVTATSDLNEPAREAVAFLKPEADKRGIKLEFQPHEGGAPAPLDEARVKQVVLNLVGNALDAAEDEKAASRRVAVAVEDGGSVWRLTVDDHGPGVPSGDVDVFKAFVSTKPAGTGLGLPIAERIVRGHGGSLTIASNPGEPTRAVATFPKNT